MNTVFPILKYISKNEIILFAGILLVVISIQMTLTTIIKKRRVRRRIKEIRSRKTVNLSKKNSSRR